MSSRTSSATRPERTLPSATQASSSVATAWLHAKPVVTAPLVGASTTRQIDDAVASLTIELSDEEIRALEAPYTPRYDFQGISDDADLQAIMARLPQFTTAR